MRIAAMAVAYHEPRFIVPYIQSMQDRVDEILVLNSTKPWEGQPESYPDTTASIARSLGASVIEHPWDSEHEQRNAGLEYLSQYDWVVVLDPDEFLLEKEWLKLYSFLNSSPELDAYVCQTQNTYWKTGYIIDPPEDYKQIIAIRPVAQFVDKRVVNVPWGYAPTILEHFSWARSDEECLRKISHYAHAHELDPAWFGEVWLSERKTNLHPLTPSALKKAIRVELPEELERLNLWPKQNKTSKTSTAKKTPGVTKTTRMMPSANKSSSTPSVPTPRFGVL